MHRPKQDDDDDEEEIGVHMWENRGKLVLDVPWLKDETKARNEDWNPFYWFQGRTDFSKMALI